ncbi:MAG: hypothetical protein RLZZ231_545 [Bacteroidota bacterium]
MTRHSIFYLLIFFTLESCQNTDTKFYSPPALDTFYKIRFEKLKKDEAIQRYVRNVDSGTLAVFNTNACNLCQKNKVLSFIDKIKGNSKQLGIVILALDLKAANNFKETILPENKDSIFVVFLNNGIENEFITKEMIAYSFEKESFKTFTSIH